MFKTLRGVKSESKELNHSGRSHVGETMQLEGDLRSSGSIDVAGLVNGNVFVSEITITETGSIRGLVESANIEINGVKCGKLVCEGSDKRFRWRNWPFVIKGKYIRSSSVTMRQVATSAERDINLFHLWFYQAT